MSNKPAEDRAQDLLRIFWSTLTPFQKIIVATTLINRVYRGQKQTLDDAVDRFGEITESATLIVQKLPQEVRDTLHTFLLENAKENPNMTAETVWLHFKD
jgi:hypothetical protein